MEFDYSTAQAEAGRRFEYWNDAICKHFIPSASSSACRDNFEGRLRGRSVGNLVIAEFSAREHMFERNSTYIRKAPDDDFVAVLVESGKGCMTQSSRELVLNVGDMAIYDASRPFVHKFSVESMLLARIPRKAMNSRLAGVESRMNICIARDRPIAQVFRGLLREALMLDATASVIAQTRLANSFVDALAAAMEAQFQDSLGGNGGLHDAVYDRALRYIDAHLDECNLSAVEIASGLNVSPRTLSRIFAKKGTAPMQEVWRRRLERSFELLAGRRVSMVTQAAYQCGFSDLSHFSRVFKKVYNVAPSSILADEPSEGA